jgi:chloride channel protein, CIC family
LRALENLRHRLSTAEAIPQLAILGVLVGLSTGVVMLMFRATIDLPLMMLLPGSNAENFEGLDPAWRAGLVAGGALLLGLWIQRLAPPHQSVGVVHVMERLNAHHGRMPLANAIVQFIGGAAALLTGQSGGREGPAIHLGAAVSSLFGQFLDLPNNSIRTLVACGTAAAIAGSFNTPLAGVVFAMEVIMMEYTIASFIPVILAAVTSTLLSQAVLGNQTAFVVPGDMQIHSLIEYPILLLEGLLVGCVASAFLVAMNRLSRLPIAAPWACIAIAGVATSLVCIVVPEVMGVGYDTVELALQGGFGIGALVAILAAKALVSAVTYALRVPVGIIGPTFVIGACTGGVLGTAAHMLAPDLASDTAIYVMLGMGAMMGAVLQAPLAALIAIVELTGTPNITLPAMLAIIAATIVTSALFRQRSVFLTALEARGFAYPADPVAQHMQRVGVSSVMERDLVRLSAQVSSEQLAEVLRRQPHWIVVEESAGPAYVLTPQHIRGYLDGDSPQQGPEGATIDLKSIPGGRAGIASIGLRSTLHEAWECLEDARIDVLCVRRMTSPVGPTIGVLTREQVVQFARLER